MPSSMPYDPSLVLASIVHEARLKNVEAIAEQQGFVDAAQEKLNAYLSSKRSLDMTKMELTTLGVPVDDLAKEIDKLGVRIQSAAKSYAATKVTAEEKIQALRAKIRTIHYDIESPVDFVKSELKTLPLASDSISMDVQYFSRATNDEKGTAFASTIGSFISAQTSWLGVKASTEATATAQNQISSQVKEHRIAGTLVLSVNCTHKNASLFAPCIINPDKGIKAWNHMFPNDTIQPTNRAQMMEIAQQITKDDSKKFSIISGMTFGSSFVGMVHVLNASRTEASQSLTSLASSIQLQAKMDAGAWFEGNSGGFGVNGSMANDVKNLLSTQDITSHVTMICMGVIPSMVANEVKLGVEKFADFDPKAAMEAIASIRNDTVADQDSVKETAAAARTGQQMVAMKSAEIKATLSALSEIDDGANKILDINSLMGALEDYIAKAATGDCGIPINYYLKDITKGTLSELWLAKYYPGEYMQIREDDSENVAPPS